MPDPLPGARNHLPASPTSLALDTTMVSRGWDFEMAPVFGVDFPLAARWTRMRAVAGLSLENPRTQWFGGFSLTRLVGAGSEAIPIDFHFVGRAAKRERLANPVTCAVDLSTCRTTTGFRLEGLGGMVTVDGSDLVGSLLKALVPGL